MVGGPQQNLATGPTRNAFDPVMAGAVSTFIRKGVPYDTAAAYVQSHGAVLDPNQYNSALAYQKQHPSATPNVNADKTVPTTMGERLASSPLAAGIVGAGTAGTAGLSDVVGRSLFGPQWDANRQALSLTNPGSDLAGNVAGGVGGMLAGSAALGRIAPGLVNAARASRIAPFLPAASDAAYGATYGASENPDNPLGGAVAGGLTGIGGGMFARGATKAIGRTIAPTAGAAAPLYDAGVFPTVGQRAAAMTGPIGSRVGKAVNTVEQAMQSVPVLGALPAMAREGARKDFQTGAFNQSLGEIGQQLPKGAGPGPEAHAYASGAFTKAYDAARSGMQFVPDPQFAADNAAFAAKLNDGTLNAEQVKQVQQRINTAVDSRLGKSPVLGGDAYKNAASELADTQRAWAKDDPLKAQALGDYLSIFDGAARRNSNPQAVQMLDQADRGYAQLVRIQQASARGGAAKDAGSFSPVDYAGAVKQMAGGVRSNAYSRGNALGQDYAQAGLSLRDTLPNSGTAERLMTGQVVGGAGLGGIAALGGGHALANPVTAGMFGAYAPGIQNLVKKAIAPREYTLPPDLAAILNGAGNGIYDRSGAIGRFGAPAALGYFAGQ
jgi:hypothetical protein